MIKFLNGQNRIEISDCNTMGFRDIKPASEITKSGAREFWDQLFNNPEDSIELNPEDIIREIYGRDESEFTFDLDISSGKIREVLDGFKKEVWDNLPEEEKINLIVDFRDAVGELLNISNLPEIKYYEGNKWNCGCFVADANTLWINKNNFSDAQEIVNTVAHEMRHAYQYERAEKLETYDDFLYANNFANYIIPQETEDGYVNFLDYQDQLIEAEARAFAGLFIIEEVGNEQDY